MGISRYPRPGYRIAPSLLREILDIEINVHQMKGGSISIKLCDLDETVWGRFDAETCERLAEAVVSRVRTNIRLVPSMCARWLPAIPTATKLDDLELEVRTYNCLERLISQNVIESLDYLPALTVKEILSTKNFGIKSLVDLLTSLESFNSYPELRPRIQPSECSSIQSEAEDKSSEYARDELLSEYIKSGGPVPQRIRDLSLPELPQGVLLDDLDLEFRTRNCLIKAGFKTDLSRLGNMPISDLLEIQGFGSKCLNDLLKSLKKHNARMVSNNPRIDRAQRRINKLEVELDYIVQSCQKTRNATLRKRNKQMFLRYTGWDGKGGNPLQVVGDEFGITRERVRQICDSIIERIQKKNPVTPVLDNAIDFVTKQTPGMAREIESQLILRGFSNCQFRLEGIVNAAELLGRKVRFTIEKMGETRFALPDKADNLAKVIVRTARRFISHWGVTTVEDVAAEVGRKARLNVNIDFATQVLLNRVDFQWLDQSSGWFLLTSVPRNRILNQIEKILSVAHRIHVSELRSGLTRILRLRGFAPPRRVILELCRQIPSYRVEGNEVLVDSPLNAEEVLGETEITMFRVLTQYGPVLQSPKFEELCLSQGMNKTTFYMYLQYSPIIAKYAYSVYGLRGARIDPGLIESITPKRQKTKVLTDYGWTQNAKIWLAYKLSKGMISSGTLSVPAAMKGFLEGEFVIKTAEGIQFGNLVTRESGTWGLGTYFRRRGGEPGDCFLLLFDLKAREVLIHIGDEDLLDDIETVVDDIERQNVEEEKLFEVIEGESQLSHS